MNESFDRELHTSNVMPVHLRRNRKPRQTSHLNRTSLAYSHPDMHFTSMVGRLAMLSPVPVILWKVISCQVRFPVASVHVVCGHQKSET